MEIALYAIGILIFLFVLPCLVITLLLFRRKTIHDFDDRLQADMRSYMPYLDGILGDMAHMRSLSPREISVTSADGITLKADWYDRSGSRTAILLHGFCSTPLNNFSTLGREFYERGWNVLMVWQRGHGKSGGKFTTLGLKESDDLLLWIAKAESLAPDSRIALYGISMGGATVCYASNRIESDSVRALCIDCCYTSPYDQMCKGKGVLSVIWAPIMPLVVFFCRLILGVNIRQLTTDSLKSTRIPAAFLIGLADKTVPPGFFRKNYEACASEKILIEVKEAPHALAFTAADGEKRQRLFDFIERSFNA